MFPKELKDYYSKFDGEKIYLTIIDVDGYECEIARIIPIIADKMNFEMITDNDKEDGFIPENYYPLARDRGENIYYWDAKTGEVNLVFTNDYENPFRIAESVEGFFKIMDIKKTK